MKLLLLLLDEHDYTNYRKPLGKAIRSLGHDVTLMTRLSGLHASELDGPSTLVDWSLQRGSTNPFRELKAVAEVVSHYVRHRPTLVHHVALKPVLYGAIAARLVGIPSVNTINGLGYLFTNDSLRSRTVRKLYLMQLKLALRGRVTRVIFHNVEDRDELVARGVIDKTHTLVVPGSGVSLNRFVPTPEPSGIPRVLFAGRMLREKGINEFQGAAKLLRERGVVADFALVGEPDLHNPGTVSREELQRWQSSGHVSWLGHQRDMPSILASATIVCAPSYREGLPKVLLEAAACQRATVTSDVPGCRQAVQHEETGLLVAPRNTEELASAIMRLLADATLRQRLAKNARARAVVEFAEERVVQSILGVYAELLGREVSAC